MASDDEPVHLLRDPQTGDRFLVYGTERGLRLDIRYEGEALWMTQAQIGELFGVTVPSVSRHIGNVLEEGELEREATVAEIATVRSEGGRSVSRSIEHYSLDMVISVGYRVSSAQATLFRKWATQKLVQFATKGFGGDSDRLKQPENADRIAELRDIIRDIRSDEANVYRELRRICAMCQDYDGESDGWREFYQHTQAKLLYAVTSHTPAEIISDRADANQPNMGLRTWPNDNIRKQDAVVSKNYLGDAEIRELNRLTTILLDIFEDQFDIGRLVVMADARNLLDQQLANLNRTVLRHGGQVRMVDAKLKAEREYEQFSTERKLARQQEADATIQSLAKEAKSLPPKPRKKP